MPHHQNTQRGAAVRSIRSAFSITVSILILLAACGSADSAPEPTKTVEIVASEYQFSGDPATTIVAGDTVRFRLSNQGMLEHEMQVLDTDGRLIDRTARLAPGAEGEVIVTFEQAGVFQVICDIDDHLSRGQRATFNVADA